MSGTGDLELLAEVAVRAALAGGDSIRGAARAGWAGAVEGKGRSGDYVTDADRASEAAVLQALRDGAPGIPALAEEAGGTMAQLVWVVDPLDGTTNFLRRLPLVGVSVALVREGRPVVGAVHAPMLGQTWVGAEGRGAEVRGERDGGGRPLRVSDRRPEEAVVGTGFPFRRKEAVPRYVAMFETCLARFEDLRRPGAAALDLAWVAEGVFEGFFELGLGPWDVAAGSLLIAEAGGVVTDWEGGPGFLGGDVLAGSPAVHAALLRAARETASR